MDGAFHRAVDGGIELFVRLTPKSSRDAIDGVGAAADGRRHLKCRVRAVPEKGKANEALERLLADALGLPAGSVAVVAGETARLKAMRVSGDAGELGAKLAALAG